MTSMRSASVGSFMDFADQMERERQRKDHSGEKIKPIAFLGGLGVIAFLQHAPKQPSASKWRASHKIPENRPYRQQANAGSMQAKRSATPKMTRTIPFPRVHAKGVVLCERTCFCLLSTF